MREIKFRAWSTLDKGWVSNNNFVIKLDGKLQALGGIDFNPERGVVVMQYTGLKDKNGKPIFEGDIVVVPNFDYDPSEGDTPNLIKTIEFSRGQFELVDERKRTESIVDYVDENDICTDIEIVGDIYKNPDLLPSNIPSKDM